MAVSSPEVLQLKEEGNKAFKDERYSEAIDIYTQALVKCADKEPEKPTLFKNRAAAYLKLDEYENAISDATEALTITPSDVKAYYRRCQACEKLQRYDEAFKDARRVQQLEPKNNTIIPVLQRLSARLQDIAREQESTVSRVKNMFEHLSNYELAKEKRENAANNLVVLAREHGGPEIIMKYDGLRRITQILKVEKNKEISLAFIRVLSEICKNNEQRCTTILKEIGMPFIVDQMNKNDEEPINAVQYLIQTIFDTFAGLTNKEGSKPNKKKIQENETKIHSVMMTLVKASSSRVMSAKGRDAILELIAKNADHDVLDWGMKIRENDGLFNLLEIASELQDIRHESSMDITESTQTIVASALDRIYYCHWWDEAREHYRQKVSEYVKEKLQGPDIESKIRVTAAITALLRGPLDVGNFCLAQQGIVEMMLAMANCDDENQQRVAAEAIIAAASKKDKCTSIVSMGTGILKSLFQSKSDAIKVRALVGLCKLGSVGGDDASIRPFAEGSNLKLSTSCRKFLVNPQKDKDLRKWAAEGLSYLTLDAEVKEDLIDDRPAIEALIELAKICGVSVVYAVTTIFVNMTNTYEKEEIIPELVKLAKFAKQHVPEEHPLDAHEYVEDRTHKLVEYGITVALVHLSKTDSKTCRELMSRVFCAMCEKKEHRGIIAQQGGGKVLVSLAIDGTEKGKHVAAQALARIGITTDPGICFPGQRAAEAVRPLMALLHQDCTGLQNFEALMCLANLAQHSHSCRDRMLQDHGFSKIENYIYEDHELIKRAAVQVITNLVCEKKVIQIYEAKNDRFKYMLLLAEDEDEETAVAAAGALAILTTVSKKTCKKVFELKDWPIVIGGLLAHQNKDLQHRGVTIIYNMVMASKEVAEAIAASPVLEALMAAANPDVSFFEEKIKKIAQDALKEIEKWKLIKSADQATESDEDTVS